MTHRLLVLLRRSPAMGAPDFASRVNELGRGLANDGPCAVYVPDASLDSVKSPFPKGSGFDALVDVLDRPALFSIADELELAGAYRVEERCLKTHARETPSGRASSGLWLVSPVCRAPALDRAAFDAHWRERHAPLALRHHSGMSEYRQALVVESFGESLPIDGIARLEFLSVEAFETRLFDSREGRRAIAEDTARFVDVARTEVRLLREMVLAS